MNFLAHAYLSFGDDELLTGNLMADLVRGKPLTELPERIKKGIELHREIDRFTDDHPVNHEAYRIFRSSGGRLAPVFLDIVYDYFLANHVHFFQNESALHDFAMVTYVKIEGQLHHTQPRFQELFENMKTRNWLYNYRIRENMARSIHSVTYRTKLIENTTPVFEAFLENENELKSAFDAFFPDLERHVKNMLFSIG